MPEIIAFSRNGFMETLKKNHKHLIPAEIDELWKLLPLDIGTATARESTGYKAAWKKSSCDLAIRDRSRYEAAANLDW